jgi:hypothetical protein
MNPKLRHLERVIAQTRGARRVVHITGGVPGVGHLVRITCPGMTLIGRLPDLQVEDAETDSLQASIPKTKVTPR